MALAGRGIQISHSPSEVDPNNPMVATQFARIVFNISITKRNHVAWNANNWIANFRDLRQLTVHAASQSQFLLAPIGSHSPDIIAIASGRKLEPFVRNNAAFCRWPGVTRTKIERIG